MTNRWAATGLTNWTSGEYLFAADLNTTIAYAMPPIGSLLAWAKTTTGVPATLPAGWIECDGSTVSDADSPINGQAVPNLNGSTDATKKYLRGNTTSGGTGGITAHGHTVSATTHGMTDYSTPKISEVNDVNLTSTTSLPSYQEMVWIIRIK